MCVILQGLIFLEEIRKKICSTKKKNETGNLLSGQISKTKSINQLYFFANRVIYFLNKLPNQIKNGSSIKYFKIELDKFRNEGKKKKLREHFHLTEFDLYIDIGLIVYKFCAKILFFKG